MPSQVPGPWNMGSDWPQTEYSVQSPIFCREQTAQGWAWMVSLNPLPGSPQGPTVHFQAFVSIWTQGQLGKRVLVIPPVSESDRGWDGGHLVPLLLLGTGTHLSGCTPTCNQLANFLVCPAELAEGSRHPFCHPS